jgi:membrane associated rhomboid family serine protease
MFPIGDTDVKDSGPAYITLGLVALNVIVFLFQLTLAQPELEAFIRTYGAVPTEILRGEALFSLITSMFLHGGWAHIISNMLYLWVFGDNIEHTLGAIPYLAFYLIGGLAATAAHIFFNPGSTLPSVGASGAIAAILGAYVVIYPRSRVKLLIFLGIFFWVTRIQAVFFLGIWGITQLFNGVASLTETAQTGGVAFWAHIGGFVFGLVVGILFRGRANELDHVRSSRF